MTNEPDFLRGQPAAGFHRQLLRAREAMIVFFCTEDWHDVEVLLPKRLTDGTSACGLLKRRRLNGAWDYRRMTATEEHVYRVERDR
ncbi:hypothetical protein [Terrihabitans rhizophilus]|uniref:Transposase n=1 Tax=Terrihabitans rhizophilus TaxID=3092662 RepID=A0ABU4RQC1_9HYPH|nr:hypothetical protein [Terrihabitans sp. PJ23]MDX6805870.1 hypothetical protein [Terrihabitans sp. PJ23]